MKYIKALLILSICLLIMISAVILSSCNKSNEPTIDVTVVSSVVESTTKEYTIPNTGDEEYSPRY